MKRTKYNVNNKKDNRSYDGIVFDSALEMRFYRDVVLPLSRSGDINYYELQKPYILQPKYVHNGKTIRPIIYVADFYIEHTDGTVEVIDTKGCADSVAKIKKKMFMFMFPDINYRWITYSKKLGGWVDYDVVYKMRKEAKKASKVNGIEKENNYGE